VRSVVDDEICESHWPVPLCCAHFSILEDHASPVRAIKTGSHDQAASMNGITIGGTNQDAKRRLRESPCETEATLMTFTLEGEGCAP
jgi:hypothetical protein